MFAILYGESVEADLRLLRIRDIRRILDDVEIHLASAPTTASRRRKLLSGLKPPWDSVQPVWQLRVGDFRVFYDVDEERRTVTVRAIRLKGVKTTKDII